MAIYIVTRHPGAVEFMRDEIGDVAARVISHLDDISFEPGDKVCGVLPLAWAARVCAAGAEAHVLTYAVPEELRGRELDAPQLRAHGAKLVRYDVRVVSGSSGC